LTSLGENLQCIMTKNIVAHLYTTAVSTYNSGCQQKSIHTYIFHISISIYINLYHVNVVNNDVQIYMYTGQVSNLQW
jgi:hypothetical protein